MNDVNVRAGIQQAKAGELGQKILAAESLLIAAIAGGLSRSWGVGIFTFVMVMFGSIALAANEQRARVAALIIGTVWGGVGLAWALAAGANAGTVGGVSLVFFIFGCGGNLLAFQYLRDLGRSSG